MKHTLKITSLVLAAVLASASLVGCGGSSESYQGVPLGKSCEQVYKLPANVSKCQAQESRH